jgi:hypothetical protein
LNAGRDLSSANVVEVRNLLSKYTLEVGFSNPLCIDFGIIRPNEHGEPSREHNAATFEYHEEEIEELIRLTHANKYERVLGSKRIEFVDNALDDVRVTEILDTEIGAEGSEGLCLITDDDRDEYLGFTSDDGGNKTHGEKEDLRRGRESFWSLAAPVSTNRTANLKSVKKDTDGTSSSFLLSSFLSSPSSSSVGAVMRSSSTMDFLAHRFQKDFGLEGTSGMTWSGVANP